MSALTILPTAPTMPEMPAELAQTCASDNGMDLIRGTVPVIVAEQAKAHLAALQAYHAPAPERTVEVWCRMLRQGVATIDEREFSGRLFAIRSICGELPAWVWTQDTLKRAWKKFKFFPTAQEVHELLEDIAQRGMLGFCRVKMLAAAAPQPALAAPEPTVPFAPNANRPGRARTLAEIVGGAR